MSTIENLILDNNFKTRIAELNIHINKLEANIQTYQERYATLTHLEKRKLRALKSEIAGFERMMWVNEYLHVGLKRSV